MRSVLFCFGQFGNHGTEGQERFVDESTFAASFTRACCFFGARQIDQILFALISCCFAHLSRIKSRRGTNVEMRTGRALGLLVSKSMVDPSLMSFDSIVIWKMVCDREDRSL